MDKINVVIYRPGEKPTQVMLEPSYENFNKIVGGNVDFKEFPAPKGGKVITIGYNKYGISQFGFEVPLKLLEDEKKSISLPVRGTYFVTGEVLKLGSKLELLGVTADMAERIKRICF